MAEPDHLIVAGASAGGVEALRDFVAGLPEDLPAAVLVVLHMPAGAASALAAILRRSGTLPTLTAEDGMRLTAGVVYVAVPDHHLLVSNERILLSHGPTENGRRPGINQLFRSAAITWGPRTIGVVLSGSLDDGTAGLSLIKAHGGLAVVQDPEEAVYRSMPDSALAHVPVDFTLPARKIGAVLAESITTRVALPAPARPSSLARLEAEIDAGEQQNSADVTHLTHPVGFSCPDCGGPLYALPDEARYRCRVGHGWTGEALLVEQIVQTEKALWTAVRVLEEKQQLVERMRSDALRRGQRRPADRFAEQSIEHEHAAAVLRRLLTHRNDGPGSSQETEPESAPQFD
ncbi:chemotaxis protein CheB [Nocardia sp. NPDC051321]|uniref:chemotaxis protein CheB n=1 Tax=Nocardia sp. NPDC051321 TaxID=3364323 RepID=UPI0037AE0F85